MQDRLLLSYYVSGQTNGPTLKDKPVHRLTLEDGTDWLFRNVNNYQYTLRNAPEESRSLFRDRLSRPHGHNATGRAKSLKNSSDSMGNRTRDLPVCSTVPQPTAPPHTPPHCLRYRKVETMQTPKFTVVQSISESSKYIYPAHVIH